MVEGRGAPAREIAEPPALLVDVDVNLPESSNRNPDAVAVVLGVEQYRTLPRASFANRDAAVFREYAVRVLGVPVDAGHVYYGTDDQVTRAEFAKLFSENGWLARRVRPQSDVYVYYAGHGAPDVEQRLPYLMPSDGDANYPTQTGFGLSRLYEELAQLNAGSVTVFLDACFSGLTRDNAALLAGARPLVLSVENPMLAPEEDDRVCSSERQSDQQ